jgi:hypothetical protein
VSAYSIPARLDAQSAGKARTIPALPPPLPPALRAALALVVRIESYCDTLAVWLPHCPSETIRAAVHERNERHPVLRKKMVRGGVLAISQPTRAALDLAASLDEKHSICRFDYAFDFITETAADALLIERALVRSIIQPSRLKTHAVRRHIDTVYFRDADQSRNIVIYSDKRAKLSGAHCCHFELRHYGGKACRGAGLHRIADLDRLDLADLVDRDCLLVELDGQAIRRALITVVRHHARCSRKRDQRWGADEDALLLRTLSNWLNLRWGELDGKATVSNIAKAVGAQSWEDAQHWMKRFTPRRHQAELRYYSLGPALTYHDKDAHFANSRSRLL